MPVHHNITRIDNDAKKQHSWMVTVQRHGERVCRPFSDGVYDGKQQSLAAAIAYRDYVLSCSSDFEHQIWVRTRLRRNNTSGIPGVGRYETLANPRTGRREAYWLACWTDEHGRGRKRKFMVSRYGESRAKALAIDERERQLLRVCELKSIYTGNPETLVSHLSPEQETARKEQLVLAAKALLSLRLGISAGCARISRALYGLGYQDEPRYQVFKRIDQAMRGFHLGEKRFLLSPSALLAQDKKLARIEGAFRPEILTACIAIIDQYADRS